MRPLSRLFMRRAQRRAELLVGTAPVGLPLCAQVSAALATDTPLAEILVVAPEGPLTPGDTLRLLRRFGAENKIIAGPAFAVFHSTHMARYGGTQFRALGIDLLEEHETALGHVVYLEGDHLYDPASRAWRRTRDEDRERFDYVAIVLPKAAA
jgi:hypothetical protein